MYCTLLRMYCTLSPIGYGMLTVNHVSSLYSAFENGTANNSTVLVFTSSVRIKIGKCVPITVNNLQYYWFI
jgi:hypothetical protein